MGPAHRRLQTAVLDTAAALPDGFTSADVRSFLTQYFPDVGTPSAKCLRRVLDRAERDGVIRCLAAAPDACGLRVWVGAGESPAPEPCATPLVVS